MIFFDVDETLLDFKASEYLGVKALFGLVGNNQSCELYMTWNDFA